MNRRPERGAPPEVWTDDPSGLVERLAADLEAHGRRSLAERGAFSIAIPGGSVAARCFPRLAALPLEWTNTDFFWVDERGVPPEDPESNYGRARALWLEPAAVPTARVHRMRGEEAELDRVAREYARELAAVAGAPAVLDYVLLGVGPDGHVASLFPGHVALSHEGPVVAIGDAPVPPRRRLSLALPVLAGARRVAIVAFGAAKAPVIHEALTDPASALPVARVVRAAARCVVALDRAAAGGRVSG